MGSKASKPDSDWHPLRVAFAHFHNYSLAETFVVLCINGLKAPLFSDFSLTSPLERDATVSQHGEMPHVN